MCAGGFLLDLSLWGWGGRAPDNIYIHIYVAAEFGSSHTYSVPRLIEFRVHVVSKKSKRCI